MHQNIAKNLSLLLIFPLFTGFIPASASLLCPANAAEDRVKISRYDNQDADNGRSGRDGRNGRDGSDKTVYSNGSPVNLDLSGKDGEDGEDGENASSPRCGRYAEDRERDLNAADGGNGGQGGDGGKGGNGGDLKVYYSNLADLRTISVQGGGGEGGRGGRGGLGTEGCQCRRRRWQVKTCKGTPGSPDHKCTEKTYRCTDGSDGVDGRDGKDGSRGSLGRLWLVKGQQPLADDTPTFTATLSQLASKKVNLSKNQWLSKNGADSLLAPGSVIADQYYEFNQRLEANFQLIWQEKQAITDFGNETAKLTLNDNQQVEIVFPQQVWINGSATTQGNLTTFTVKNAILPGDVTRLAVAEFAGTGKNLNLKIVDLAAKSDAINTKFKIKYRAQDTSSGYSDYQTVYEGEIPQQLVTRDYNRFTLALGQLRIPDAALQSGMNIDLEIVATRFLGERSAQQSLNWRGVVRKSK
ncbi:hypothetical protein B6N60_04789 [Richelia sinica FACHB-800]|uniref:Collagen-like protein n=1 Tax=Richelia sinica FACHB-800 TaxID=1357546 RepID=A0A975TC27_9NOST|nr:collagen-like protein [Richelia sinica]MBD2666791.1 collagen-like protein [Richelia sinica FACHB-800]QXE26061.1 hypothetical protein B6N60_04789 [Richelia sinica FACHB-800]